MEQETSTTKEEEPKTNLIKFPKEYIRPVEILPTEASNDLPPSEVLKAAVERNAPWIAIVEIDEEGLVDLYTSSANAQDVFYYLSLAARELLDYAPSHADMDEEDECES